MAHAKLAIGGRKGILRKRELDGQEVKPTYYFGRHAGHGNYMSGYIDSGLVCDDNGKPLPLRQIGKLV